MLSPKGVRLYEIMQLTWLMSYHRAVVMDNFESCIRDKQGQKIHNFNFLDEEFIVWRIIDCS